MNLRNKSSLSNGSCRHFSSGFSPFATWREQLPCAWCVIIAIDRLSFVLSLIIVSRFPRHFLEHPSSVNRMKLFVVALMICGIVGDFTGCPMDGCESTLSGFVDISVSNFNEHIEWQRTDLLATSTRGCVSNEQTSLLCALDSGYGAFNVTNGQLLWLVGVEAEKGATAVSLPVVNYQGYAIIANSSGCILVNPGGDVVGTFAYLPSLIPPLAGPFVTNDGQIIVADSISVSFSSVSIRSFHHPRYFSS